jgi:hypothetical protein
MLFLICGIQSFLFPIDDFLSFFHKKYKNSLYLLWQLTSRKLTKSNLYFHNFLAAAQVERTLKGF